jgi:hypothetical protein
MFVLLEHTTRNGVHWDLIIEVAGRELLPTWRLLKNPLTCAGEIAAEPIADHPPHFLEYEGRLRNDRGRVRRLDRGAAVVEQFESQRLVARLAGDHLRGRIAITAESDGVTCFFRIGGSTAANGVPL